MEAFEDMMRRGGSAAIEEAERFFMKADRVHRSLQKISHKLDELGIPYAIAGGMALVAHGYDRTTVDVDVLVTEQGLKKLHEALDGLGYVPPFEGSKQLRDTETNVRIEFLVAGQFPGDGKPKPVTFPNPATASVEIDGIRYLGLPQLVELKLASGLTGGVARLKDFADVVALIETLKLPADFSSSLNGYVQAKYIELWNGLNASQSPE